MLRISDQQLCGFAAAAREMRQRYPQTQSSPGHITRTRTDPVYLQAYLDAFQRALAVQEPTSVQPDDTTDVDTVIMRCPKDPLRIRIARFAMFDVWKWLEDSKGDEAYARAGGPAAGENRLPNRSLTDLNHSSSFTTAPTPI